MKYTPFCAAVLLAASFPAFPAGPLILNEGVGEHLLYFKPEALSNEVGSVFQIDWDSGRDIISLDYKVSCAAKDETYSGFFWSATLLFSNATSGEWHSLDEFWDVKVEFFMSTSGVSSYETVPFYDYKMLGNNSNNKFLCKGPGMYDTNELSSTGYGMGFPVGRKGKLSLKLKKKIVNGYTFISTPIAMIYGALNQKPNLNKPFVSVRIAGFEITLPEKCQINAGQIIEVDFGDVPTTKLDGEHYPVRRTFDVTCSGGDFDSGRSSVTAEFIGNPSAFSSDYFATDHDGIAIKVKDEVSNIIRPQDKKKIPLEGGHKTVPLIFSPVAQSKNIEAGEFTASIVVRMLIE